jgi:energy-coupling factor transport system permease protein
MLKDITLGQYFPGNSLIHRLDPRTKLLMLVVYIVALFMADGFISYGIMLVFLLTVIGVSGVPGKAFLRGMKPLVFILVFTAILNLLMTPGETKLIEFWVITITLEGVIRAFFMLARILMLITCTFLLTYTTSPIALTDGLESLLSPLKVILLLFLAKSCS